tara:strand:- start:3272 stop:3568 length:297 start_codon:yes stop_codon:yes gene_type:complete
MEYKCITCTFYRKNIYEDQPPSVTFYGTEKQVIQAVKQYVKDTGYNVNETHVSKVAPKGSYWYDIYGDQAESINKKTKQKLEKLKKLYIKNNKKTLIL